MAQQREVLLIEEDAAPSASVLSRRLRNMGFRTTLVSWAEELTRSLDQPELPFRAVLLSTSIPSARLSTFAAPLRQHLAAGELTGLVVGETPAPEIRRQLREAGFSLALWRPFDDHTLRFQVNRAFLRARSKGPARGELRAPLGWQVSIHSGGRRKEAQVYNLSEGGAFLETPRPSMIGAEIDVELQLPAGLRSLPANVLHTNVPGNLLRPQVPVGMGIRFSDPSPTVSSDLARIVAQRSLALLL
jgi:CheY-like chemotaxis protein